MTLLILCIPRFFSGKYMPALANFFLAIAFGIMALGRSQTLGFAHGQNPRVTRAAFAGYALTLSIIFGRFWLFVWRARCIERQKKRSRLNVSDEEAAGSSDGAMLIKLGAAFTIGVRVSFAVVW